MKSIWIYRLKLRNYLTDLLPSLAVARQRLRFALVDLKRYETEGFRAPLPDILKRAVLRRVALESKCATLVETGTFLGDTPWQLRDAFLEIHTVEISPVLASLAKERFKRYPFIHCYEGDSGTLLAEIVPDLKTPTLFWLDGHYSHGNTGGAEIDCPILRELETIFSHCKVPYTILIDDARTYGHDKGMPPLEMLLEFIRRHNSNLRVFVENDMIFATPTV